jgi:hypothetical protein
MYPNYCIFTSETKAHLMNVPNLLKKWSGREDLNLRPLDPQRFTLQSNTFKYNTNNHLVFPFVAIRMHSYAMSYWDSTIRGVV